MNTNEIFEKAIRLESISAQEAIYIYKNASTNRLAETAHTIRQKIKGNSNIVTWQIDRNINITNVCVSGCKFCNFHCKPHQTEKHFITTLEQYRTKIDELIALGGDQILLQGGLHPKLDLQYYEGLFRELKNIFPNIKLHALGPPEIFHIAKISNLTTAETLQRLCRAGLDSLPGAGAEILDNEFRRYLSPAKCSADQWLAVMGEAHSLGIATSATMVYGINETPEQRVAHLIKIRELHTQRPNGTPGFVAFIPWVFSTNGTELEKAGVRSKFSQVEYLRTIAISRIVLNNIDNIQASWLTVGVETAQLALWAGANDLGSIMIEENVVASTGLRNKMDADGMQRAIREAGFLPRLRDQQYNFR